MRLDLDLISIDVIWFVNCDLIKSQISVISANEKSLLCGVFTAINYFGNSTISKNSNAGMFIVQWTIWAERFELNVFLVIVGK